MNEEPTNETVTNEGSVLDTIEEVVEDVKEKVDGGLGVLGKVDETMDTLAPVLDKISPAVEIALNLACPGAGTALMGMKEMGKAGVKGVLNLTAADAWSATGDKENNRWDHLVTEVNEKLGIVVVTSALDVSGGFLYRVLTCKKDGSAPKVVLQFIPVDEEEEDNG